MWDSKRIPLVASSVKIPLSEKIMLKKKLSVFLEQKIPEYTMLKKIEKN